MRFLHTAAWQIGMKASHVGEARMRVRDERLAVARHVVQAARGAGADFTLVAGDTVEDNGVDRSSSRRAEIQWLGPGRTAVLAQDPAALYHPQATHGENLYLSPSVSANVQMSSAAPWSHWIASDEQCLCEVALLGLDLKDDVVLP